MTAGYCEPDPHSALLVCAECNPSVAMACNGIPATTCAQDGVCLPNHCFDGTPNLGETAKDCGGPACLPAEPARRARFQRLRERHLRHRHLLGALVQ